MTVRRARSAILAAFALLLLAGPASASPPPDAERMKQAKANAEEGTRRYNLGQFEEALESYSRAYEAVPAPGLLFNIGQCHRALKRHERAIFFLEGYLREKPDAPNRDLVEEILAEERALLDQQRTAEAAEAARRRQEQADRQQAEEARRQREEEDRRSALLVGGGGAGLGAGGADRAPALYEKWWFWTAVGVVAVAAAGTAIYLGTRDTVLPEGTLGTLDERMR